MPEKAASAQKLSRQEAITVLAHYYRAEAQRSLAWRERLDRTTNWAVGGTTAFLGFGFSHPEFPHPFFFFGFAIVYMLLVVESRRYRFYDAYEFRVRLLHQHFIYGTLTHNIDLEEHSFWVAELASDLQHPQYKMSRAHALGRRLYANYFYLFGILLTGWCFKVMIHPVPVQQWTQFIQRASFGPLPGWTVVIILALFFAYLLVMMRLSRRPQGGRDIFFTGR